MTRPEMKELPIEDIGPDLIGARIEVYDGKGATVGFRLGRYERTTVDGEPQWRLISDQPAWSIKLSAGSTLRVSSATPARGIDGPSSQSQTPAHPGPRPSVGPVTAHAPTQPRSPQSWVTQ